MHSAWGKLATEAFFDLDALEMAQRVLGCVLVHGPVAVRITEVEAYCWPDDSANHCYRGKTPRNTAMFGPPGHVYMYVCYGVHHMLNIAANQAGEGAGVLIRACEPLAGADIIQSRRGIKFGPNLMNGPGKVAQALALDQRFNHQPLFESDGLSLCIQPPVQSYRFGPRIGIDGADEKDHQANLRFALPESKWVGHAKRFEGISPPLG